MKDLKPITKDRETSSGPKYKFRGIEAIYNELQPLMATHGIFNCPEVIERSETAFTKTNEYNKETRWLHVYLKVMFTFYALDGSKVVVVTSGEALDNSDKATNKAMSAAHKYALIQLFCIPTDEPIDTEFEHNDLSDVPAKSTAPAGHSKTFTTKTTGNPRVTLPSNVGLADNVKEMIKKPTQDKLDLLKKIQLDKGLNSGLLAKELWDKFKLTDLKKMTDQHADHLIQWMDNK